MTASIAQVPALLAPVLESAIEVSTHRFTESQLSFETEKVFAVQQLLNNGFLMKIAQNNPQSLQIAMMNLASVGLSLNPVEKWCYLIPRKIGNDQRVILDISYQGLIQIAKASGAISSCTAVLVYESEKEGFEWRGEYEQPVHPRDPFLEEKGKIVGGYAQTKMPDGSFIYYAMSSKEIAKRRDCSEMVKRGGNNGPWAQWEEEMIKKTIIKQASKWWPGAKGGFAEAVRVLNEDNGEGLPPEDRVSKPKLKVVPDSIEEVSMGLPKAPTREQLMADYAIDSKVFDWIEKTLAHASSKQAWSACAELYQSRLGKNESLLAFGLSELEKAQNA